MSGSLFGVQEAVYGALMDNTALQGLIGNPPRLYDVVPPAAIFPYTMLGDMVVRDFDTKEQTGFEQTFSLHIWSRYRGRKELKSIMETIYSALHDAGLSVAGASFISSRFQSAATNLDPDGLTLHGVMRFRIVVQF